MGIGVESKKSFHGGISQHNQFITLFTGLSLVKLKLVIIVLPNNFSKFLENVVYSHLINYLVPEHFYRTANNCMVLEKATPLHYSFDGLTYMTISFSIDHSEFSISVFLWTFQKPLTWLIIAFC